MIEYEPDPRDGPVLAFRKAIQLARSEQRTVVLAGAEWDKLPVRHKTLSTDATDLDIARCMVVAFVAALEPQAVMENDFVLGLPDNKLQEIFNSLELHGTNDQVMIAALDVLSLHPRR